MWGQAARASQAPAITFRVVAGIISGIALATVFSPTGWLGLKLAEAGIQVALERMLVDPDFLLRVYRDSNGCGRGRGR